MFGWSSLTPLRTEPACVSTVPW